MVPSIVSPSDDLTAMIDINKSTSNNGVLTSRKDLKEPITQATVLPSDAEVTSTSSSGDDNYDLTLKTTRALIADLCQQFNGGHPG